MELRRSVCSALPNIAFKVFKVDNEEGNMGDGEAIDAEQAD